ncbi:long-chain-fatty-acid--CoA ligase [Thermanaerovibrio acidaminovorans]|uniref:long-chain-fatty-acid--CoA ligase n=1 Tax=Thermanaerovibrio acidaminovorans TaxID=81462 RepID=UPI002491D9CF|nr:long-chain fatty acid--CoA ligase [Thermanaerovibrio acidaminovorans]
MRRLDDAILERLSRGSGEHCLWWQGAWWSREALWGLAEECYGALKASGFGEGMRLGLCLPNGPSLLALSLAAWMAGGTVVPLNWKGLDQETLDGLDLFALVDSGDSRVGYRSVPVVTLEHNGGIPEFAGRRCGVTDPDLAVIFATSGTTGKPKLVPLTHGNLFHNAQACVEHVEDLEEDDVFLNALPNYHALGFTVCGLLPLLFGFPQVMVSSFMPPEGTMDAMRKGGVTVLLAVPIMISMLVGAFARKGAVPNGLRVIISGGDRLPRRLDERCQRVLGVPVLEGYGLTETSPVLTVNPSVARRRPGTVGTFLRGVQYRVLREDGTEASPGETGRLFVKGPSVFGGYFGDQALNRRRFVDGWFDTEDLVRVDQDGYVTLESRVGDLIIVGGFNVYPREVEAVLMEHPKVREAAVVGVPNPLSGQAVKAFVVPRNGEVPTLREIAEFCRERLPHYKVPRQLEVVDHFPRSSIGEVIKKELKGP